MKLIMLNILTCSVPACGIEDRMLELQAEAFSDIEGLEFVPEHVVRFLPRLDYPGLIAAIQGLGWTDVLGSLPATLPDDPASDEAFLYALFNALFVREVQTGTLTCPGCGTVYPITDAIPRMLLAPEPNQ
ncbi:uncharacterised protein family UPF0434/Trm112 [Kipferlia bialata]|uniref:Trm112p-like protein n=1 Tax=Kipferlia bialata TaxID=797122 RepID=A0A391NLH9_9EUKA|nr:uncharacterised protein family UPF0434/Trm112 [Kipferlia bialata]|eukprot:g5452.t1